MKQPICRGRDGFPDAPVAGSDLLIPITSWAGFICETRITSVVVDAFWVERIKDGVCYFFRWLGKPRSTVLVVYNVTEITHVECHTLGDCPLSFAEAQDAVYEVLRLFGLSGYKTHLPLIDSSVYPSDDEHPSPEELWFDLMEEMMRRDGVGENGLRIERHFDVCEPSGLSETDGAYQDPLVELRRARGRAKRAGFSSEEIDLLFPWLNLQLTRRNS